MGNVWIAFYIGMVIGAFMGILCMGLLCAIRDKEPFPGEKVIDEESLQHLEDKHA